MKVVKYILGVSSLIISVSSCQSKNSNTYSICFKGEMEVGLGIMDKEVKKDTDLNTTIFIDTSKLVYKVLPNSLTKVISGGKDAEYTYTVNEDKTKADFKMLKESIKGNIVISLALVDADRMTWITAPSMSEIEETKVGDKTYYSCDITGVAKNISNADISIVCVSFSMYNENGDNIGTAYDNTINLKKGSTWAVDASFNLCKQKPVRFETNRFEIT